MQSQKVLLQPLRDLLIGPIETLPSCHPFQFPTRAHMVNLPVISLSVDPDPLHRIASAKLNAYAQARSADRYIIVWPRPTLRFINRRAIIEPPPHFHNHNALCLLYQLSRSRNYLLCRCVHQQFRLSTRVPKWTSPLPLRACILL